MALEFFMNFGGNELLQGRHFDPSNRSEEMQKDFDLSTGQASR